MMNRIITTVIAGLALCGAAAAPATADENVIVLDAPDIQKLRTDVEGFRIKDIIGTDVYSNGGKRIGELEDFVLARGGYLYAVIDTADGALTDVLDLSEDEIVVVPWNQLRTSSVANISAARRQ